jgi:L-aspartate oxidase
MNTTPDFSCDVLIIGSGAAGLSLALRLAEHSSVTVLSKGPISEGSTFYAQGGIAAVFDETDSIESHVEDTLIAGAGLRSPCGHLRRQQRQIMRPVAYRSGRAV